MKPFAVQNLGKYERQAWQTAEFGEREDIEARQYAYRNFILQLYKAEPVEASQWIHGRKSGRWVHVGAVDSPISPGDVTAIANSLKQLDGSGNRVDVPWLGLRLRPQRNGQDSRPRGQGSISV
ncbi:MAG: hypothetical protein M5U18_09600 [Dehalococcoidia bacterium]|nr:hypothetical protein [Dehalococcoidia bacterium]